MSVGGRIIEITPVTLENGAEVNRLWVVDQAYGDESLVYAERWADGEGPSLRDEVWWQSGRIYFDGDKRSVRKIGYSGAAKPDAPAADGERG